MKRSYGHDFLYKCLFLVHPAKNAVVTGTSADVLTSIASFASIHALASRHSPQAAAHLPWVRQLYAVYRPTFTFIHKKQHAMEEHKHGRFYKTWFNDKQICPLPLLNHSSEMSQNRLKFGVQSCRCFPQS
jgi:hypothetical protein